MDGDTQELVHTGMGNLHLLGSDPVSDSQLLRGHTVGSTANPMGWAPLPGHRAPHPAEGLHRVSPKAPFPGVLTQLSPPHPRYVASWAPCAAAGPSSPHPGGDEGWVRPQRRHRGAAPNSSHDPSSPQRGARRLRQPPARGRGRAAADATAAKGGWKTGNTGSGPGPRLEGPTLLLRLPLRKTLRFSLFRCERREVGMADPGGGTRVATS